MRAYPKIVARLASAGATVRAIALASVAVGAAGCNTLTYSPMTAEMPSDYRLRHPIVVEEKNTKLTVFVGAHRGSLTPTQRAEVGSFAQSWRKDATGGVVIEVPTGTPNQRAAHDVAHEVKAILAASEIPASAIAVRPYHPGNPDKFAPIKVNYPRVAADAGPCGLWPHDIGPSEYVDYAQNRPYWNLGCANQRNLAAMVDNPADLVQPRGETPAYTGRRTTALDKYRKGEGTATVYPVTNQAKISDLGQ
jgi:pilus assembly protein CpaD